MNKNGQVDIPLYDLYTIWYEPFWKEPWFIIVATIIGLFLICGVIGISYIFIQKKRKRILTSAERFNQILQSLNPHLYGIQDRSDEFYVLLTNAIKQYMGNCLAISPVCTDDEFMHEIRKRTYIQSSVIEQLEQLFEGAQYSKFAQQHMAIERMTQDLKASLDFLEYFEALTRAQDKSHQK